jgi:hypothetical protein
MPHTRIMTNARTATRRRLTAFAVWALLAASGAVAGAAVPGYAAPPGNDSIATPRAITGIPTRIVQDTRQATSSADDGKCVNGDSVWYRFRPSTTNTARVVTVGSNFDSKLAVFRGPATSRTLVRCSDDAVGFASAVQVRFVAGATYWIAVSACCDDRGVGGRSVLTLYPPRPVASTVTLGSVETGVVSARIFASGTVRCATPSLVHASVTVSQRVGTSVARGTAETLVPSCDSKVRPWSVKVDSGTGVAFQEGSAALTLSSITWDGFNVTRKERTAIVTVGSNPNRVMR